LVSIEEAVKERVKILLDDKPVQDICLVAVRILNSGNLPIVSADYERQVSLCFSENTRIISAEVSETKPNSLQATISLEKTKVVLAPVLLNSGDSITLKMLVNQFDGKISVYGHIVGVKDIRELERKSARPAKIITMEGILRLLIMLSIAWLLFFLINNISWEAVFPGSGVTEPLSFWVGFAFGVATMAGAAFVAIAAQWVWDGVSELLSKL
jgi:hypothetical protein